MKLRKLSKLQRAAYKTIQDNHDHVMLWDSPDKSIPEALAKRGLVSVKHVNNRCLVRANSLKLVAGNVYIATHVSYTKKQTIVWWNDEIVAMVPGKKKPLDVTRADNVETAIDKRGALKV